jgi:hypothetical protein
MEEIQNDHPRSAAIVGATYLEDVTHLGLLTKMVDLSKDEESAFSLAQPPDRLSRQKFKWLMPWV